MPARYAVGIDLGTTNCAVSYLDLSVSVGPGKPPPVQSFTVPQLVREGEVAGRLLLPSFAYLSGGSDLPEGSLKLPWDSTRSFAVGEFARGHGAKVPGRLVSSAKSWLCHTAVDRQAAILPWGAPAGVAKISPVEASARYLAHLREAWNHKMADANRDESARLENQDVVLTVPASFDTVARELTVQSAAKAGLPKVTLLEEPQAAFYWWIVAHHERWWNYLRPGTLVLVADVGGGTTDFSLIAVIETPKGLGFERFAVGDHLILGGDNMDVALARLAESRLAGGKPAKLDIVQWAGLVQACRAAKEKLLTGDAEKVPVVLAGRGSAIIGGTLRTELTRQEVQQTVLEGFFPTVAWEEEPTRTGRAGLQEFGLPYTADPAIPKHLSSFLRRHLGGADGKGIGKRGRVSAVLFNGGVFNPPVVRNRFMEVLTNWLNVAAPFGEVIPAAGDGPRGLNLAVLENAALDLAVAHGAAYYGLVRRGKGLRIGGGTARSYYVGIGSAESAAAAVKEAAAAASPKTEQAAADSAAEPAREAAPAEADGGPTPDAISTDAETQLVADPATTDAADAARTTVLCVAPAGLEEGQEVEIPDRTFELLTGRPVGFRMFSSSLRPRDRLGEILVAEEESLLPLAPLRTVLSGGKRGVARTIPVRLRARVTEVGTLELYCVSVAGDKSWRLQFQVRDPMAGRGTKSAAQLVADASSSTPAEAPAAVDAGVNLEDRLLAAAEDVIRVAFGKPAKTPDAPAVTGEPIPVASLNKKLEAVLEIPRGQWPTLALRRLWEVLLEVIDARKISEAHEARWCNLAGFCLRPGFGDPLDEWRLKKLWPISYTGLTHVKSAQAWVEWWTLWRRVAGGLSAAWQNDVYSELGVNLHPSLKRSKPLRAGRPKPTPNELAEMWRLAGALERLDAAVKEKIGAVVFVESPRGLPGKPQLAALGRLGARMPLTGPLNCVVHPEVAGVWLTRLLGLDWSAAPEEAAFAVAQIARRTGDRSRDVEDDLRAVVIARLRATGLASAEHLAATVAEVTELRAEDRATLLGEELPAGLRLAAGA